MTPERWRRVRAIFGQALDLADSRRDAYLEEACGDDDALVGQVESLLMHHDEAQRDGFLSGNGKDSSSARDIVEIGNHDLLEEIGRGGMGVVYKARQRDLQRIVALKTIRSGEFADEDDVARFRSEAEAAARLDHPNIVPVYEVGAENGRHFFSMALVEGSSLAARLAEGPLTEHDAARLVQSAAKAVHFAHQQGIVHRDLKPANILLSIAGEPKITDFGLAKRLDDDSAQTRTGTLLGTPSYMSPEQARCEPLGPATDVYSLGAVLYETLTGRPPFRAATVVETLDQIRSDEPVAPRALQPKLSRDVETICLKCLRKEPSERYADAEALADDLERFLHGVPIQARPISTVRRLGKWVRRNPALSAAGSVAVGGLIAAVTILAIAVARVSDARNKTEQTLVQVREQRDRADRNFAWAKEAVETTAAKMARQRPEAITQAMREAQEELLITTLDFYENLARENSNDPEFEAGRGRNYWWLAVARSGIDSAEKKQQALYDAEQMESIFARLAKDYPDNADYHFMQGWGLGWRAILLRDLNRVEEAERCADAAIAVLEAAVAKFPNHAGCSVKLGACYMQRGWIALDAGRLSDAREAYQLAVEQLTKPISAVDAHDQDLRYFLNIASDVAVRLEDWENAARVFAGLLELDRDEPRHWYDLAIAQLGASAENGQAMDDYRQTCETMLKHFEGRITDKIAERIVYTCVPSADAIDDVGRLKPLADQSLRLWNGNVRLQGAAAFRRGDYKAALSYFEQTREDQRRAWDYYFMAMACQHLRQDERAEDCLRRAERWLDVHDEIGWSEQIETRSAAREAESLISAKHKALEH